MREMTSYRAPAWRDLPDLDLYMDQVIGILEKHLSFFFGEEKVLTSTMINNYVKNRLLPPPVNKKYGRQHLARLFELCICKSFMQLSDADALLNAAWNGLTPEKAHGRFCRALDQAVNGVFDGGKSFDEPADPVDRALFTACVAAASILRARLRFQEAVSVPPAPPEAVKEAKKEPRKKEKKPKKSG